MSYSTRILKPAIPVLHRPLFSKIGGLRSYNHSASNPDDNDKELYQVRIRELEQELEQLNFLDHPLRIVEICSQIKILRKEIER